MASWVLKALVQGGVSLLPANQSLNYLCQKHLSKSLQLGPATFDYFVVQTRRHLEAYFRGGKNPGRGHVVELGTGWYPILPVFFYLSGASRIWTVDKSPWLRVENVKRALHTILDFVGDKRGATGFPWLIESRIAVLKEVVRSDHPATVADLMRRLNIEYLVIDARQTGLPAGSVDFFFSNGVLQAIPGGILAEILAEFRRISAPQGRMSHHIIIGDQYAGRDRSITPFNFLKFSKPAWRIFNNSLHYQNRLRVVDYRRLHAAAGFQITGEQSERGSARDLDQIRLADEFKGYSRDELLVTRTWIEAEVSAAADAALRGRPDQSQSQQIDIHDLRPK